MRSTHPGQVLKDELDAIGITLSEFARQIDVPPNRVSQIVNGKRAVSGDSVLRLGHWFGTDPAFWMTLQAQHDMAAARAQNGPAIDALPTRQSFQPRRDDQQLPLV